MHVRKIFSSNILMSLIFTVLMGCAYSQNDGKNATDKQRKVILAEDFEASRGLKKSVEHPRVKARVQHYQKNPAIFTHLDNDRKVILRYILSELKKRDMPAELAMIPLIESSYRPNASNRGQYVGLWQFGAQTARNFGVPVRGNYDGRYNLEQSTKAALDYMQYLNKMFEGDWLLTMAAYNAGEGRIMKMVRANAKAGKKADYWSLPLPPVTKAYIPNVLALSEVVNTRQTLKVSKDQLPRLVKFTADSPEDLKKIVNNSAFTKEYLRFYNPNVALNKGGARTLMLPEAELRKIKGIKQVNIAAPEMKRVMVTGSERQRGLDSGSATSPSLGAAEAAIGSAQVAAIENTTELKPQPKLDPDQSIFQTVPQKAAIIKPQKTAPKRLDLRY